MNVKNTFKFEVSISLNFFWRAEFTVDKAVCANRGRKNPRCIWFTGLSGAGKSTLANMLEVRLLARGRHTYLLADDNVRHGLNWEHGFPDANRVENIRRVAEDAKLMVDAGLQVLVSLLKFLWTTPLTSVHGAALRGFMPRP